MRHSDEDIVEAALRGLHAVLTVMGDGPFPLRRRAERAPAQPSASGAASRSIGDSRLVDVIKANAKFRVIAADLERWRGNVGFTFESEEYARTGLFAAAGLHLFKFGGKALLGRALFVRCENALQQLRGECRRLVDVHEVGFGISRKGGCQNGVLQRNGIEIASILVQLVRAVPTSTGSVTLDAAHLLLGGCDDRRRRRAIRSKLAS